MTSALISAIAIARPKHERGLQVASATFKYDRLASDRKFNSPLPKGKQFPFVAHALLRALQPALRTEHVRVVAKDGWIGLQDVERDGDEGALWDDELAVFCIG